MANAAWLVTPIALVVFHRFAAVAAMTTETARLGLLAVATSALLVGVGLIIRRLGVGSRAVGVGLAALFWLSGPTLTWPDWITEASIQTTPLTLDPATDHRDLVVVLLDGFPRSDILLAEHGYDDAEFRFELSEHGFHLVPEAWSNSSDGTLAATAALAGVYPGTPGGELDRRRLTTMLDGDNPVADLLTANGYATTHLGTPSATAVWFGGLRRGSVSSTTGDLVAAITEATGNDSPDFVFAHLSACERGEPAAAADDVVADARCWYQELSSIIDATDASDSSPDGRPVTVIAGTTGVDIAAALPGDTAGWPRSAIVRGLAVLAAIDLPPGCEPPPDDATVAVIVHIGVACAIGADPNPSPERSAVLRGGPVDPDGELDVNLNVLRSSLAGQNLRKSQ